jgi:hypothetical protein
MCTFRNFSDTSFKPEKGGKARQLNQREWSYRKIEIKLLRKEKISRL